MLTRAEMLALFIDELRQVENRLRFLVRMNEMSAIQTRAHVADALAQMVKRSDDPDRPFRENGSFLPREDR